MTYMAEPNWDRNIEIEETLDDVGDEMLRVFRSVAARDTGKMVNSAGVERRGDGEDAEVELYVDVDYWVFPEFGTADQEPQPGLRPALARAMSRFRGSTD